MRICVLGCSVLFMFFTIGLVGCTGGQVMPQDDPVFYLKNREVSAEMGKGLWTLPQGGVVEIREHAFNDLPLIPYEVALSGPQFIMSDAPEYIPKPECAVMREKVKPGNVRIYVYNCNGLEGSVRRISAVIRNLGNEPLHYRFLRYGYHKPDTDYGLVAKTSLAAFLTSKPDRKTYTVPVGGALPVDPVMEKNLARYNELVHGFYEIEIDQPAEITIVQTDPDTPSPIAEARIDQLLPNTNAGAGRGLFIGCDLAVRFPVDFVLDTADEPMQLRVANGMSEPWLVGTASSSAGEVRNVGNYGVLYRMKIPYTTSDGRGLAMLTWNPNSQAQWCGYMGNAVLISEGRFPAGLAMLPSDRVGIDKNGPNDMILVQIFPPLPEGQQGEIEMLYSPPGACCIPTPFIFLPIEMK